MVTTTAYHVGQDRQYRTTATQGRDGVATAIYSTTNYRQFLFDKTNRPIDQAKLVRLYDAVVAKNLLADNPILVALDFTVLDGQHRLKVAESLQVPIYYQFSSDTTMDDVATLNGRRTPWKLTDYLHFWCEREKEDYIVLRDFMRRYDWLIPHMALELCYYGDKIDLKANFAAGQYRCNNVDFATKVVHALLDFRATGFEYWKTRVFAYSVANLLANSDYDHSRMMAKLKYNPKALRPAVTMDDYYKVFDEIYNYKTREDNRIPLRRINSSSKNYRADKKAERSTDIE